MIQLTSNILKITNIIKTTKAELFKELCIGDEIRLAVYLKPAGRNRSTYASYIQVYDIKRFRSVSKSFNELPKLLDNFTLEESKCQN